MIDRDFDDDFHDWNVKFSNDDEVQLKLTIKANKKKKQSKEHTRICVHNAF